MKLQFKNWLNENVPQGPVGATGGATTRTPPGNVLRDLGLLLASGQNQGKQQDNRKLVDELTKKIPALVADEVARKEAEKKKIDDMKTVQQKTPPPPQAPKIPTPAVPAARAPAMGARGK